MSNVEGALKALIVQTVTEMGLVQGNAAGGTPAPTPTPTPTPTPAASADPFAGMGGGTPQPQQVTAEMIQEVVMPLVQNEGTKAKLTAEMQAMGIASLADVKPEQMNELYQRFCRVRDEGAQAPAASGAASSGGGII